MTETFHEEALLDRAAMVALRAMLALSPKASFGPNARPAFDDLMKRTVAAKRVRYEQAEVGGVAGGWCRAADPKPSQAILYIHGGAYVVGSAEAYGNFVGQITDRVATDAFIPDYRLAPEHRFPSAIEDVTSVYEDMVAKGVKRIAFAADSAGGGLALALMNRLSGDTRYSHLPKPVACAVMSPWTDLSLSGDSLETRAGVDPLLSRKTLSEAARLYLVDHDPMDPDASPLFGALANLPPIMFHVGDDEVLLDDARRYAHAVNAAGGSAELHIWQGMVHVFPSNSLLPSAAGKALDMIGDFLGRAMISAVEIPSEMSPATAGVA